MDKEIVYKKWFDSKPFVDKFCKFKERGDMMRLSAMLHVEPSRIKVMMTPGHMIRADVADKYAVRMRIPSGKYMVRLV